MPWDHPERWDRQRLAATRTLFNFRDTSMALRRGGLRWIAIEENALLFLRESPAEMVLVYAARAGHPPIRIPATVVGSELEGLVGSVDLHADGDGMVTFSGSGAGFGLWRVSPA